MDDAGFSAAHLSIHIAAIRHHHLLLNKPWLGRTDRINLVLKSIAKKPCTRTKPRKPLTMRQLTLLHYRLLRSSLSEFDKVMAWAALTLVFFGALRGTEYLSGGNKEKVTRRTCKRRNVVIKNRYMKLFIAASKTDQNFRGTTVRLPALKSKFCPIKAMKEYFRMAGQTLQPHKPLFLRQNGQNATVSWINRLLKKLLPSRSGKFTTHSLRIGFATSAAAAGVSEKTIRAAGRWRGSSHLRYVKGPRHDVQLARALVEKCVKFDE